MNEIAFHVLLDAVPGPLDIPPAMIAGGLVGAAALGLMLRFSVWMDTGK